MIVARGLSCAFESRPAVRGLDLDVEACEIVGIVGPSGAGKTTLQRMLATLLAPTSGEATMGGYDLRRDVVAVRRLVGYVGYVALGDRFDSHATVDDEIISRAEHFGLSSVIARRRAGYLREVFGLGASPVSELSIAERSYLALASALVHEPRVLLLDEPSMGLDAQARASLWAHIRTLRDDSLLTVLLTTRDLDGATELCDRVVVLDEGRVARAA